MPVNDDLTALRVSVVTVCFNEEKTIEHVMNSVLSQDYAHFEYVIKDGASSDGTGAIIENFLPEFEKKGLTVSYVSEKDAGIYDAMNQAVKLCRGSFVIFMNADDRFYDDKVLSAVFTNHTYEESDVLYGDTLECEYGEYYYYMKNLDVIRQRMPFSHQSVFAKREVLLQYPFDLKYRLGADYNFLLTAYANGLKFTDVNTIVSVISKEGVSSVSLYDSFYEAVALRRAHGMETLSDEELDKKFKYAKLKQFGMDYFPDWLKYLIRKWQRFTRHQKRVYLDETGHVKGTS